MSTPATEVAAELVAARREGRSLDGFPGAVPANMAEAYAIQDLAISRWPDTIVGWKIGFIPSDRRTAGEPDRLVGPIWARQLHLGTESDSAVAMEVFSSGFAAVEAELVIRLRQDVPAPAGDWTPEAAADLEQELLIGIEVASSPIPDINSLGPTVIASDFGNNNGLVLGPVLADGLGAGPVPLALAIDDELVAEGSSDNLPGGMHSGLATALNVLADRGHPVGSGMVFATGAITGIHPIGPGQHCRVELPGGPAVELKTIDARTSV